MSDTSTMAVDKIVQKMHGVHLENEDVAQRQRVISAWERQRDFYRDRSQKLEEELKKIKAVRFVLLSLILEFVNNSIDLTSSFFFSIGSIGFYPIGF